MSELFNTKELSAPWEQGFYESDWKPDTLHLTEFERNVVEFLMREALPRHMPIYDWNLPYAESVILVLRREFAKTIKREERGIVPTQPTKEDCQACKRYNDSPEICFDYPELGILKARENCSIHNKEDCHGL